MGDTWTKVGGVWKEGKQWTKVNGVWKEGETWTKVDGFWRSAIIPEGLPNLQAYKYSYGEGGYVTIEKTSAGTVVKTKGVGPNYARPQLLIGNTLQAGDVIRIECSYTRGGVAYIDYEDDRGTITGVPNSTTGTYTYTRTVESGKKTIRFGAIVAGSSSHWIELTMNAIYLNGIRM